jgi:hypothetical protein
MSGGKNLFSKIMLAFGFCMVAIFFGLGIIMLSYPLPNFQFPGNMKQILGFFFLAYGLFRLARIIQQIREQKYKEYDDE